eukprot:360103-Chlamydomonas_euryale.AAC.7
MPHHDTARRACPVRHVCMAQLNPTLSAFVSRMCTRCAAACAQDVQPHVHKMCRCMGSARACSHGHSRLPVHVWKCTCMFTWAFTLASACMEVHVHVHKGMLASARACTYMHVWKCTCTCTCVHASA